MPTMHEDSRFGGIDILRSTTISLSCTGLNAPFCTLPLGSVCPIQVSRFDLSLSGAWASPILSEYSPTCARIFRRKVAEEEDAKDLVGILLSVCTPYYVHVSLCHFMSHLILLCVRSCSVSRRSRRSGNDLAAEDADSV